MLTKVTDMKQVMAQAMRTSDSRLYASVYAENGQILMEGGLLIEGRVEIENQIASFMALLGPMDVAYVTKDIWQQDDVVYESGHFSYKYADRQETAFYTGTYVFIWQLDETGKPYIFRNISIDD